MAKSESTQHVLDRVRSPRVQVTYDVETRGAIEKKELPFLMGVLGDFTGNTPSAKKLKDRRFVNVDRDNFDSVMKDMAPSLNFRVSNKLSGDDSKLNVELNFRSIEDFGPERVAQQVEPLRKLMEVRQRLSDLRNKMAGNDKLEELLRDIIEDTDKRRELKAATDRWAESKPTE
jgi:type VI secretion system protein ImpB